MSIPALDGTVECNDFCVLIFLILIEKKKERSKAKSTTNKENDIMQQQ